MARTPMRNWCSNSVTRVSHRGVVERRGSAGSTGLERRFRDFGLFHNAGREEVKSYERQQRETGTRGDCIDDIDGDSERA